MRRLLSVLLTLMLVFSLAVIVLPSHVKAATFTVTNTSDSGAGSLRQAILDANINLGTDTINFNIPGAGPHTIQPLSTLPTITDPVIIDGYTQPGASPNTNGPSLGINAVLKIELDGSNAGINVDGFHITSGSSTIRGLVINHFRWGIALDGNGANIIEGNFIGTDATGTTALGNGFGVYIFNWSPNNIIGGATPGARNLISGNNSDGVHVYGHWNVVQGNLVGTDVNGSANLGNNGYGIRFDNTDNHTVSDNIVAYNAVGGIILFSCDDTTITHNEIRFNRSQDGIGVSGPASGNVITANHITENDRMGISLYKATNHSLTNNVVVGNKMAGIWCHVDSSLTAFNNTIVSNTSDGIYLDGTSTFTITNAIIWGNGDDLNGCTATYSDISDGDPGTGNISADPLFVNAPTGDYRLRPGSPCIDAGTNEGAPTQDIIGNPRPIDGDRDGTAITDMGAYEYVPPAPPSPTPPAPGGPVGGEVYPINKAVILAPWIALAVAIIAGGVFLRRRKTYR